MSHKRLSQSMTGSWKEAFSKPLASLQPDQEAAEEWLAAWTTVFARDLIDSRIIAVDAELSVEDACELLLTENVTCLAVRAPSTDLNSGSPFLGLFDYADVNAFLTLAATSHTFLPDDLVGNPRVNAIVTAAKAGRVPVHLVSNLSDKNPIAYLPYNSTLISLLETFSRGTHRALIQSFSSNPGEFVGMVSDRRLLSWFDSFARETTAFQNYLCNPIMSLSLPSLNLNCEVVSAKSSSTILDAMKLMSEKGVSSVAVVDENNGSLLSAVSVTDVGKIVVPSQSNQILAMPLHHFVAHIKDADGSTDGVDKYPVYSVLPSSLLSYTIEKLLATNAHRVFVTRESGHASPPLSSSFNGNNNLTGIVSIVDILSLFARLAKIPNVDPTHMQRHRRASSTSSHSSLSEKDFLSRSRSNSRASIQRSSSVVFSSPPGVSVLDNPRAVPIPILPGLDPIASMQRKDSRRNSKIIMKDSI